MKTYHPIPNWDAYGISECGEIIRLKPNKGAQAGKVLKQHIHKSRGYLIVRLYQDNKAKSFDVHVLMAMTFLGYPKKGYQVCHNNGIKNDCRLSNLRLDTVSGNQMDRSIHGTSNRGEQNANNKYSTELIKQIKIMLAQGHSCKSVSEATQVNQTYIKNIKNGYKWKWLTI
jgi:hypothetical protein